MFWEKCFSKGSVARVRRSALVESFLDGGGGKEEVVLIRLKA